MANDIQQHPPSTAANVVFDVLNPVPFGLFVGALIFDAMYAASPQPLWFKSAAWLIVAGLLIAIVPRLINLARVWFSKRLRSAAGAKAAFFLYLVGVVFAIVNAFVHSRDAYAAMPEGLWLSALTVLFILAANVTVGLRASHVDLTRSQA